MKDFKSILILLLAMMLLVFAAYYIYDKSKPAVLHKQAFVQDSAAFKEAVHQAVEDSLKKINSSKPDTVFLFKDSLNKKTSGNSSTGIVARGTPNSLNPDKTEKKGKNKLTEEAVNYFTVSRVNLERISKKTGNTSESTSLTKGTNKFILTFTLQNKMLSSGRYSVYVVILKPDQRVLRSDNDSNDYFIAAQEGPRLYTKKIHFSYIRKSKKAITCVVNNETFSPGVYTVKIYFNGKKISESTNMITKGGLFG